MKQPARSKSHVSSASLHPGEVRPRPKPKHSQAHAGVSPLHPVTHRNTSFQPLPRPLGLPPYHYDIADSFPDIARDIEEAGKMVFHVVGDTGGVQDGEFQNNVAAQMIDAFDGRQKREAAVLLSRRRRRLFHRHEGRLLRPVLRPLCPLRRADLRPFPAITTARSMIPRRRPRSTAGCDYFMQAHPDVDPISKDAPRVQLNLPNVYWTLITPLATIVGMYTNVPEGGSIDSTQQQWVTNEFATAPTDRALILALHHPIYSFDVFHSGSSKMADVLENAIRDTGRVPNLVLSGPRPRLPAYRTDHCPGRADAVHRHRQRRLSQSPCRSSAPGDKAPTPARF